MGLFKVTQEEPELESLVSQWDIEAENFCWGYLLVKEIVDLE